jgi:hypothetical protein
LIRRPFLKSGVQVGLEVTPAELEPLVTLFCRQPLLPPTAST